MRIHVSYFALLRERAGKSEEYLDQEMTDAGALYRQLDLRYGFGLPEVKVRVAINDAFAGHDTVLQEGDRVVFIVPVSGG